MGVDEVEGVTLIEVLSAFTKPCRTATEIGVCFVAGGNASENHRVEKGQARDITSGAHRSNARHFYTLLHLDASIRSPSTEPFAAALVFFPLAAGGPPGAVSGEA